MALSVWCYAIIKHNSNYGLEKLEGLLQRMYVYKYR